MLFSQEVKLRGALTPDADLGARSWFRTGGKAEFLFEPEDIEDLALFLRHCPKEINILALGLGSNMLVRDGGVKGVVIALGFDHIKSKGCRIEAGSAVPARKVAHVALANTLSGFEFMRGIPGSVGGCLAMNAGAYGHETANVFVEALALDRRGKKHILKKADMLFGYRRAVDSYIFAHAVFEGEKGQLQMIEKKMNDIVTQRKAAQPAGGRTGGSTFKNPSSDLSSKKAWQLIEEAGCRGFSEGEAYVCEKHCNFLINRGGASAADIEKLGERIRAQVYKKTGVLLAWEICCVGEA